MSRFDVRRTAKLKEFSEVGPFVAGSLCRVKRRCGNLNCKCARGQVHFAYALSFKVKGKTKTVHVPKEMVKEVQEWVTEYKRVKSLMDAVSRNSLALIGSHVRAGRGGVRKKVKKLKE